MTNIVVIGMGPSTGSGQAMWASPARRCPRPELCRRVADVPGHKVTGVQQRSERSGWKIERLNSGHCPFDGDEPGMAELIHRVAVEKKAFRVTDDYAVCQEADVILVDVQTPTDGDHVPHYESLREASAKVGRHMRPGILVIVESTVAPGTTQNVVQPILERESGLRGQPSPPGGPR